MRRIAALLLCAVIALTLFAPAAGAAVTAPTITTPVFQLGGGAPRYEQGEDISGFDIILNQIRTDITLKSVYIEMQVSGDLGVYPFRVDAQSYMSPNLVGSGTTFKFHISGLHVRGDAEIKYYDIPVNVYYTYDDGSSGVASGTENLTFRVFVGPAPGSGSTGTDVTHIPKVIISGFSTNPSEVVAGEEFTLNVTFKNTSNSVSVSNMKAALTSDVFNPVAGSSTLFVDSLAPGASKAVSIRLHAKADAAPGSYNASFALSYDVGVATKDNAGVSDTEVVAIPVKQVPKIQVSTMQIVPSEIYAGNDINIMTSVNNTGKSTLYNVSAKITDSNGLFTLGEQYLGNLQSGASGAIDLYITPQSAGSTVIQLDVTYEDENGNLFHAKQTFDATIMEKGGGMDYMPPDMIDPYPQEQKGGGSWWIWVVLSLIVAGVAALILIKRRKAKVQAQRDRLEAKRLEEIYLRNGNGSNEETKV